METYVVTATRGESGRFGDSANRPSPDVIGQGREKELRAAAQAGEPLGLTFVGRGFDVRVDVPLDRSLRDALQAQSCLIL